MYKVALGIYSIAKEISNFKVLAIKCDISGSLWQLCQGSPQQGLVDVDSLPELEQEGNLHQTLVSCLFLKERGRDPGWAIEKINDFVLHQASYS